MLGALIENKFDSIDGYMNKIKNPFVCYKYIKKISGWVTNKIRKKSQFII